MRDVVRVQLSRLLQYVLSADSDLASRLYSVELLATESRLSQVLDILIRVDDTGERLALHLHQLLSSHVDVLSVAQRDDIDDVMTALQHCGVSVMRLGTRLTDVEMARVMQQRQQASQAFKNQRTQWVRYRKQHSTRCVRSNLYRKHSSLLFKE